MDWHHVQGFVAGIGAAVGAWLFQRALRLPGRIAKPGSALQQANDLAAGAAAGAVESVIDSAVGKDGKRP
jgi:hypothetical protein